MFGGKIHFCAEVRAVYWFLFLQATSLHRAIVSPESCCTDLDIRAERGHYGKRSRRNTSLSVKYVESKNAFPGF